MRSLSLLSRLSMGGVENGGLVKKPLNEVFESLPTTVFTVMTNLAIEHGSVNLGQGFPDEERPAAMKVVLPLSGPSSFRRRKTDQVVTLAD